MPSANNSTATAVKMGFLRNMRQALTHVLNEMLDECEPSFIPALLGESDCSAELDEGLTAIRAHENVSDHEGEFVPVFGIVTVVRSSM